MHPLISSTLFQLGSGIGVTRDMMRAQPVERSAGQRLKELITAYAQRSKDIGNKPAVKIKVNQHTAPTGKELVELLETDPQLAAKTINPNIYASNVSNYSKTPEGDLDIMKGERLPAVINTNPNADEAWFAHELGHSASTNTKHGDMIRRIRDFTSSNPATKRALGLAMGLSPIAAGAMTPGDEDLDEAILGSLALSSPILIDEALATKNALAIMEQSGQRANLRQRGRLAGGYLSYLANPIATATLGNFIGNQFDEDI